ncbi:hypothetical protein OAT67_02550 [Bacteriovoracaceae bacterium]|nr:hypothetical protein [Bacteriovoracaceae bacterium]
MANKKKWTREKCVEIVSKCNNYTDLRNNYPVAYRAMLRYGWNDLLNLLPRTTRPNGYWSKERCLKEALKYSSRKEFSVGSHSAYIVLMNLGLLDVACSHMVPIRRPSGYWTKETILESVKGFKSLKEWRKKYYRAYDKALELNIINKVKRIIECN